MRGAPYTDDRGIPRGSIGAKTPDPLARPFPDFCNVMFGNVRAHGSVNSLTYGGARRYAVTFENY